MTEYIIPSVIFLIVFICLMKKVPLYESVIKGAKDGLSIVIDIFPTLVMVLFATSMLKASGALDYFIKLMNPALQIFNIPKDVMPMILLRPVSGSGAFGILTEIFAECGPDSRAGRLASVIMGSTETTFYTMSVYFAATGVKDVKRAIPCAVIGDIVGVIVALLIIK